MSFGMVDELQELRAENQKLRDELAKAEAGRDLAQAASRVDGEKIAELRADLEALLAELADVRLVATGAILLACGAGVAYLGTLL